MKHGILTIATTGIGKLKRWIQEQLVRQLFVGHAAGQRGIRTSTPSTITGWKDWAAFLAFLVELGERVDPPDLPELGP